MTWLRRYAKFLMAAYSVVLLVALLSPSSPIQSGLVYWLISRLWDLGLPYTLVTFARMEVVMNAVIIAPVSFLGSLWKPAYSWRDWTALGFTVSLCIEIVQTVLLPQRQGSFSDVVANTVGALLGVVLMRAAAQLPVRSSRPR
jgi:glycopeptide antibiotics resistance protein